jgi:hypothetical protein
MVSKNVAAILPPSLFLTEPRHYRSLEMLPNSPTKILLLIPVFRFAGKFGPF